MENKQLDLDTFGEFIDELLEKNHIQMLVEMPEGTQDTTVTTNTVLGPVGDFYILLKALPAVYSKFAELIDGAKEESFIDATLEMVKEAILDR